MSDASALDEVTASFRTLRTRRLIRLTLFVMGVDILISLVTYGWDVRTALLEPGEWEADEWLATVAMVWVVPMGVLVWQTTRVYLRTTAQARAMRDELTARRRVEVEQVSRALRERTAVEEVIATHAVTPHFQPIVHLDGEAERVGFEALARFPSGTPQGWFTTAATVGLTLELEIEAIQQALPALDRIPQGLYLSVNASPATVDSPAFFSLFRDADAERLVVEVTEMLVVKDYERTNRILTSLRRLGVRVAVDDAGAGFASLQHILNLAPDFIKLDRSLIQRLDMEPAKRAMMRAIVAFARDTDSTVVAEGVEEGREMEVLRDLGVGYAQGYYFGRPAAADHWFGTEPAPGLS